MSLYAISCDPLARGILKNKKIRPFQIAGESITIQQYADDITCYLTRGENIEVIYREFQKFERATGQKLNPEKTEILHINPRKGNGNRKYDSQKRESIKILGQYFGRNQYNETLNENKFKISRTLITYKNRKLTWMGKKAILNSLMTTKILYNARVVPPTKEDQKELEKTYFQFIWHPNKMEAIPRKTLIAEKENGALRLPDIESRIRTCTLEKIAIIKKPTEIWHKYAIYEIVTRIKIFKQSYIKTMSDTNSPYQTYGRKESTSWKK